MELKNYTLKFKDRVLLQNVNVEFHAGKISHILGKNGTGKSQFAKDLLLNKQGNFTQEISNNVSTISSFSNLPSDLTVARLYRLLQGRYSQEMFLELSSHLNLENIDQKLVIRKLSDGQKQKLKILSFFLEDKDIIILDELTNTLDKATIIEIYKFLTEYIEKNPKKHILNITHDLSDLTRISGDYYLLENLNIEKIDDVEEVKKRYLE
ncbi:MAG: ATP-binding cassette domain-containing protein [Streptococcaceae bacterium]|nr:ATP-binding cassette domain-containing protein [Streptococcaceae bacterium]MCL2681084.1 ATP-binding cassette domain-containing protein [Streptococcaceae bacterium]